MKHKDQDVTPDWEPRNQAENIIHRFGGARVLARALGLTPSTVYKWTYYESEKGKGNGTNGLIPTHKHRQIRRAAAREGILLTAKDWYPDSPF